MRIILSPAKKMNANTALLEPQGLPVFLNRTEEILSWMKAQSNIALKTLWGCNEKIAEQNFDRLAHMDLKNHLTPAVLSYEGIVYQYMAPTVFEDGHFDYVQEHLRILSAFYGVLKPMDGVTPYRLEMQARASIGGAANLYDFWGDSLFREVRDESGIILNLASEEYSKCIAKYLTPDDRFINISFVEQLGGKLVTKGTYAKMARGDMVRFMAENHIEDPAEIKTYNRMGYKFRPDLSTEKIYCFERHQELPL